jgi:hypothetical protein
MNSFFILGKFIEGGCKSDLCQVLMVCTSEFVINTSIFLTMNSNNDSMYCEYSWRMFNFLNNSRHDTLLPAFIIILIALFCNLNVITIGWVTPENYTVCYDGMYIREIYCSQAHCRDNRFQRSN